MSLSITSFSFVCFVMLTLVVYYVIPRDKWLALGFASVIYYTYVSKGNVIWVIISIISVWMGGVLIDRNNKYIKETLNCIDGLDRKKGFKKRNRIIVWLVVCLNLGMLLLCKFTPALGLPLAISFYTLSAVGYIVDVFKGGEAEKNPLKIGTFLSFFPLLTQGPIVRYKRLKNSLFEDSKIDIDNIQSGTMLILWGCCKKQIIADRCYPLVNGVFDDYLSYSGPIVFIAVIGYMLQLYCDFSGGIDVALGVAQLFGVKLPQNFKQPYFSLSIGEFWRRWHISLGEWFKDYIYIPLAMSKLNNKAYSYLKNKKSVVFAKIITTSVITFMVWILNGIWHGAGWKYVMFGAYMGIIIALENYAKIKRKDKKGVAVYRFLCLIRTLLLVATGWMMIRVGTVAQFFYMFKSIFRLSKSSIYSSVSMYLGDMDIAILIFAVAVLIIVEIMQIKRGDTLRESILATKVTIRSVTWVALIMSWLILSYDMGNEVRGFIYAKF